MNVENHNREEVFLCNLGLKEGQDVRVSSQKSTVYTYSFYKVQFESFCFDPELKNTHSFSLCINDRLEKWVNLLFGNNFKKLRHFQ